MGFYREDITVIDMESGTVHRSFMNHALGEGDIKGDRFGVKIIRNGEAVNLTGVAVIGYFIRANETTVVISGERNENVCWVELPQACYTIEGNFTLSIKLSNGTETVTVRIVDGTIVNTVLGDLVDPGSVIPDLSEFTELVERAEAAAAKIEAISITSTLITGTRYRLDVVTTE